MGVVFPFMGSLMLDRYHFYFVMILMEMLTLLSLSNLLLYISGDTRCDDELSVCRSVRAVERCRYSTSLLVRVRGAAPPRLPVVFSPSATTPPAEFYGALTIRDLSSLSSVTTWLASYPASIRSEFLPLLSPSVSPSHRWWQVIIQSPSDCRLAVCPGHPITSVRSRLWINREARDPYLLANCGIGAVLLFKWDHNICTVYLFSYALPISLIPLIDNVSRKCYSRYTSRGKQSKDLVQHFTYLSNYRPCLWCYRVNITDGSLVIHRKFPIRQRGQLIRSTFCPLISFRQGACIGMELVFVQWYRARIRPMISRSYSSNDIPLSVTRR